MLTKLNDPIEVAVRFQAGKAIPWKFLWQGREIKIVKVNLVHHVWEGRSKIYYFAVSDNSNYFKLRFDTDKLTWRLVESYAD